MKIVLVCVIVLLQKFGFATVFAAKCANGIVIGTDSLDAQGPLVGNRFSEKMVRINPLTLVCMASYNSDVRDLCTELRRTCLMYKSSCDEILGTSSIAHVARRLVHDHFPDAHVLIVGGETVKEYNKSPGFSIHEVLPGGSRIEQDVAVAGSGSELVLSLINEFWDRDGDVKPQNQGAVVTATRLKRAMQAAIRSDPGSGGNVALWLISKSAEAEQDPVVILKKMEI